MLQADAPEDLVLATGVGATVGQFLDSAFKAANLDPREHVEIDPTYYRPSEVNHLLGDPTSAEQKLGWKATTHWDKLARLMVRADIKKVEDQLAGRLTRNDR